MNHFEQNVKHSVESLVFIIKVEINKMNARNINMNINSTKKMQKKKKQRFLYKKRSHIKYLIIVRQSNHYYQI